MRCSGGLPPTLDTDIFDLPWLRGYGNVKSLPVAYQENPGLKQAAATLKTQGWADLLAGFEGFMTQWTGLAQAHTAHGVTRTKLTIEDKAWMLETLTGQDVNKSAIEAASFTSITPGSSRLWNTSYVDSAWNRFVQREAQSFAIQAQDWLKGTSYSLNRDRFVITDGARLAQSVLERFNDVAGKEDATIAATVVLRLIRDGVALDAVALKAGLVDSPIKGLFVVVLDQGAGNQIRLAMKSRRWRDGEQWPFTQNQFIERRAA